MCSWNQSTAGKFRDLKSRDVWKQLTKLVDKVHKCSFSKKECNCFEQLRPHLADWLAFFQSLMEVSRDFSLEFTTCLRKKVADAIGFKVRAT